MCKCLISKEKTYMKREKETNEFVWTKEKGTNYMAKFFMGRMMNLKGPHWHDRQKLQANLVLKKPFDPGTAIGRNIGKRGCEMGMEFVIRNDWGPFATIGGVMHICNAWAEALPVKYAFPVKDVQ